MKKIELNKAKLQFSKEKVANLIATDPQPLQNEAASGNQNQAKQDAVITINCLLSLFHACL
jgi:hypothetical protein